MNPNKKLASTKIWGLGVKTDFIQQHPTSHYDFNIQSHTLSNGFTGNPWKAYENCFFIYCRLCPNPDLFGSSPSYCQENVIYCFVWKNAVWFCQIFCLLQWFTTIQGAQHVEKRKVESYYSTSRVQHNISICITTDLLANWAHNVSS